MKTRTLKRLFRLLALIIVQISFCATLEAQQTIRGSVPQYIRQLGLRPIGRLDTSKVLSLGIGLSLRNRAALTSLLQQLYNPTSPNFHQWLEPAEFASEFGPSQTDYQTVINYLEANGFTVIRTYANRTLIDASGTVGHIEKAFHVRMMIYNRHIGKGTFFAPDSEPTLDVAVPIVHISGLRNDIVAVPNLKVTSLHNTNPVPSNATGSMNGAYASKDFRAAYAPGVSLNGYGQTVGSLQFDGYTATDITQYESDTGLPNVTLQNVLIDGATGNPSYTGNEIETTLDIEMQMAMAPGVSKIVVFEAPDTGSSLAVFEKYFEDILDTMVQDSYIKQFSCSWGLHDQYWHDIQDQTADNSFLQMAADGQSFFQASGDEDAITNSTWTNGSETVYSYFEFPEDDPNVTSVGGTKLTTTGPGGSYVSEVVWNPGTYGAHPYSFEGSTGGVSNLYSIPTWQQNANPSNAQVSSSYRNVPDVALVADSVYEYVDNTSIYNQGGTSAAAPLWAGFTAMVNQEAANNGQSTVGFINPAIYRVGQTSSYNYVFHDIPAGSQNNNKWPGSGSDFTASTGYDLTTGWGTPQGQNLINYLSGTAVTAAINGPSYLPPNQPGGYAALATGGTPPYSYQWWKLEETTAVPSSSSASPNIPPGNTWYEIGTNSPEVSTSDTYNFEIKCVMTDAFGKNSTSNIISVQVGGAGNTVASNPGTDAAVPQAVPKTNSLSQNYPNPFNPSTQIRFALSKDAQVRLVVYDVLGREVAQLADQDMTAGYHSVTWNANNVPSGVYIYRLSAGNFVQVKRMLLVK